MEKSFCYEFTKGKAQKRSCSKSTITKSIKKHHLLHSNLCSPFKTTFLSSSRYFLIITNNYNCKTWIFFLKYKNNVIETFKEFHQQIKKTKDKI